MMREATGFGLKRIRRLLDVDPGTRGFRRNGGNTLDCGLPTIGEMSTDVLLMRPLLAAVPDGAALPEVGDVDQLPPAGLGRELANIIASGARARSLSIELRAARNAPGDRRVERFGWTFALDDKVMRIKNDCDRVACNGDIGPLADVDSEAGKLSARLERRDPVQGFGEPEALAPAHATTAPVPECPAVVIPVLTQHFAMLNRNSPRFCAGLATVSLMRSTSYSA